MAKNSTNRAEARNSATESATATTETPATGAKRRPAAPAETDQTSGEAAAAVENAEPVQNRALIVISPNPKRKGSKAATFFDKYPARLTMSTIDAARYDAAGKELVRGKDLSWDAQRRHILIGDEASNFPVDGSREEQAEYLASLPATEQGFSVDEKRLIAWGFKDAPVEEKTEATAEVKQEEAATA